MFSPSLKRDHWAQEMEGRPMLQLLIFLKTSAQTMRKNNRRGPKKGQLVGMSLLVNTGLIMGY